MKKIYTLCAAALVAASTATAQQLPDGIGTFDGALSMAHGKIAIQMPEIQRLASNLSVGELQMWIKC